MIKIHPMACVHPDAVLGDGVEVGPFAFIDANVTIGAGTKVLNNATKADVEAWVKSLGL